jgi:parallel beta-helix repeat protein
MSARSATTITRLKNAVLLCAMFALGAEASAAGLTYVKSNGSDANAKTGCAFTAPCRTFSGALPVTSSGGKVVVLDSADYGVPTASGDQTVNITQSVSITALDGVYAGLAMNGSDGIVINGSGVKVSLEGLRITGLGGTSNGINFVAGAQLQIKNCVVSNMGNNGIQLTATGATIFVNNVEVHDNVQSGILMSGSQTAMLDGVRAEGNAYGVYAASGAVVDIRNSTAAGNFYYLGGFNLDASTADTTMLISRSASLRNASYGIWMMVKSGFHGNLTVDSSLIEGNPGDGIEVSVGGTATLTVMDSKVVRNGTPNSEAGAIDLSAGGSGAMSLSATFTRNVIDKNGAYYGGVYMQGPTVATFEGNVVTGNSYGIYLAGGNGPIAYSRGDNTFKYNGTDVNGTLTPLGGL